MFARSVWIASSCKDSSRAFKRTAGRPPTTPTRSAASRANPAPAPAFDGRYVNCLFPYAFQDFNQATFNWRMLQLYSTLGAGQRQNLGNGGALSLGQLSPKQNGIVASM